MRELLEKAEKEGFRLLVREEEGVYYIWGSSPNYYILVNEDGIWGCAPNSPATPLSLSEALEWIEGDP